MPKFVPPTDGVAYLGGATTFTRVARTGIIAALDVTTNKLAWRYQWPEQCYSGTLATAGGLLFVGRNDGRLTALDSATGKQLWEFQTGAGMHAPVSTFEHKGKQYVLAFSAGSALIGSARGDSVWLFGSRRNAAAGSSRHARVAHRPRATPPAATAPRRPPHRRRLADANLVEGKRIFTTGLRGVPRRRRQGRAHGSARRSTSVADLDAAIQTVTAGRNNMPPFRSAFTPEQIRDVSAYVVQTLAAGPAR